MKRWFHVTTVNACYGFAIDQNNIVTDVAPIAYKELYGKSIKDPLVRKWLLDNTISITEIK